MKRILLLLALLVPVLAATGLAVAAGAFDGAKSSTARFHDIDQARAAGYSVKVADLAGIECIAQPGEGAMGVHMLNPHLLFDEGVIDATQPEHEGESEEPAAHDVTSAGTGSGRMITVSATRTISSTGRSAASAWARIASGLDAW